MEEEFNDSVDSMTSDAIVNIAEGIPSYDRYTNCSIAAMKFQDKTIEEWLDLIKLPDIPESVSVVELEEFNRIYMTITELIMRNYSISKTGFNYSVIHYKKSLANAKTVLVSSFTSQNRKVPGKDLLEDLAKNNIMDVYTACKIAEMFFDFWSIQFEKIKLASYRLSGMNSLKNTEFRMV